MGSASPLVPPIPCLFAPRVGTNPLQDSRRAGIEKNMRSWLPGRTWADIRFQVRPALTFQLLVQLAAFALGGPLLSWVGRHLVLAAGEPAVTNFDIAGFLLSPMGILFLLILAALAGGALLAELAGQTWI